MWRTLEVLFLKGHLRTSVVIITCLEGVFGPSRAFVWDLPASLPPCLPVPPAPPPYLPHLFGHLFIHSFIIFWALGPVLGPGDKIVSHTDPDLPHIANSYQLCFLFREPDYPVSPSEVFKCLARDPTACTRQWWGLDGSQADLRAY